MFKARQRDNNSYRRPQNFKYDVTKSTKPSENPHIYPRRHWTSHNTWDGSVDHSDFKGTGGPGSVEE